MAHKYAKEIHKWAESPDGTGVWVRNNVLAEWGFTFFPSWGTGDYIVDDTFATIRKAQAEGKPIQANIQWESHCPETFTRGWSDFEGEVDGDHNGTKVIYRIKPNTEAVWQYVCKNSVTGSYKLTTSLYTSKESAEESEAHTMWIVIGRYIRSKTTREVK